MRGILVFATMGTIAANPSPVELMMLTAFGVLGFLMRRFDYPDRAGGGRPDPRPDRRKPAAPRALDQPRRSDGAAAEPVLGDAAGIALIALLSPFVLKGLRRFQAVED